MPSAAAIYGRARELALSSSMRIDFDLARLWSVTASGGGPILLLPDATKLKCGTQLAWIHNAGAVTFAVMTYNGVLIANLTAGQVGVLHLEDNSTVDGTWQGQIRTAATAGGPAARVPKLYVAGGQGTETSLSVFDQSAGTWSAGTASPNNHADAAGMPIEGRMVLVGTYTPTSAKGDALDESGAWAAITDAPAALGRAAGAAVGSRGLVFGGSGPVANVYEWLNNAWATKATLPIAKSRLTARAVGAQIFLFSGEPVPTPHLGHDPVNDAYWTIATMPSTARRSLGAFQIDGAVFVCGGKEDVGPTRFANVDQYTPATDAWATKTAMGAAKYGGACFGDGTFGFYCGGQDSADNPSTGAARYQDDAWTALTVMNVARKEVGNHGAAL